MLGVGGHKARRDLSMQSIHDYEVKDLDVVVANIVRALSAKARKANKDSGNLAKTRGATVSTPQLGGGDRGNQSGADTSGADRGADHGGGTDTTVPPISSIDITTPDPRNRKAAMQSKFWPHLHEAEIKEVASLKELQSWKLVPRHTVPKGQEVLRGRWVYAYKRDALGKVTKVKGRYTVDGGQQTRSVDFMETYASTGTMSIKSFRIALAITNLYEEVEMDQWDAKCAYINSQIEEGLRVYCRSRRWQCGPPVSPSRMLADEEHVRFKTSRTRVAALPEGDLRRGRRGTHCGGPGGVFNRTRGRMVYRAYPCG